ncbi:MAG: thrombospondin type 3 repeat-containing protein [Pyrinomonadaceae bacterium]
MMLPRVNSTRTSQQAARAQDRRNGSRQTPRITHRFGRWSFRAAIALCLGLALQSGVLARLIFDPNDSAFSGAILEPFDPSNASPGATSFTITRAGVTFTFSTTSANGIFVCSSGNCRLQAPFPEGIDIAISPPVAAIGFQHTWVECPSRTTFNGSAGSESFAPPTFTGPRSYFVGAADIGAISRVRLESGCGFPERWDDMRFVPSAPPPPSPTPTPTPPARSDLVARKTGPVFAGNNERVTFDVTVANRGPDAATGAQVVDFLPGNATLANTLPIATLNGRVATINIPDVLPNFGDRLASLQFDTLPFPAFGCYSKVLNVALATSSSIEGNPADNLTWSAISYDNDARRATNGEICGNNIDDNCDGLADCADPGCGCLPRLIAAGSTPPPCLFLPPLSTCTSQPPSTSPPARNRPAANESCGPYDDGHSGGDPVFLPPVCCDGIRGNERLGECAVPNDPNFKESDPAVNASGYGYTEAGRMMTYTVHYENIGDGDAHDVSILDVLPPDLDASTLVVNDGGTYDPASRVIVWRDAVVPPHQPRTVSFRAAVRADAPHGTRIHNTGTIIFPDAVPPSRIDTNFVEHVVLAPGNRIEPDLKVFQCTQMNPGEWQVDLVNEGYGFAYNVTAEIINPPASINVTDGSASVFSHPDDDAGLNLSTVIPLAATGSTDTIRFTTETAGDPCGALTWRIRYQNARGEQFTRDVQDKPDGDADGVADAADNCPDSYNPAQVDLDADRVGNACDSDDDGDGSSDGDELDAGSDPLDSNSTPEVCDGIDNDLNDGIDEGFTNTDGDSQADCVDADDDNDGQSDADEIACSSDPLNANSKSTDSDADQRPDCIDADDDNDGVADSADNCAYTPNANQRDADGDGRGDVCDNCPAAPNPGQEDTDGDGLGDACENVAPDCGGAYASIQTIWPPNHQKVAVAVLGVRDADGDPVSIRIDRVMQDEPTRSGGDGNTCPDAYIPPGSAKAYVLAERAGGGNGRVYTIYFTAADNRGASCQGSVKISVPHDQGGGAAVDDGPLYDSTVCLGKVKH